MFQQDLPRLKKTFALILSLLLTLHDLSRNLPSETYSRPVASRSYSSQIADPTRYFECIITKAFCSYRSHIFRQMEFTRWRQWCQFLDKMLHFHAIDKSWEYSWVPVLRKVLGNVSRVCNESYGVSENRLGRSINNLSDYDELSLTNFTTDIVTKSLFTHLGTPSFACRTDRGVRIISAPRIHSASVPEPYHSTNRISEYAYPAPTFLFFRPHSHPAKIYTAF